jgi:uncharacterized protein
MTGSMQHRSWSLGALFAIALLCTPVFALQAEEIDAAKQAGIVGEQSDGYLGLVRSDAAAEVQALVSEVNTKRRAAYEEIATRNGTPVDAVARLAGAKLVERAAPGQYVRDDTGRWKQK